MKHFVQKNGSLLCVMLTPHMHRRRILLHIQGAGCFLTEQHVSHYCMVLAHLSLVRKRLPHNTQTSPPGGETRAGPCMYIYVLFRIPQPFPFPQRSLENRSVCPSVNTFCKHYTCEATTMVLIDIADDPSTQSCTNAGVNPPFCDDAYCCSESWGLVHPKSLLYFHVRYRIAKIDRCEVDGSSS